MIKIARHKEVEYSSLDIENTITYTFNKMVESGDAQDGL